MPGPPPKHDSHLHLQISSDLLGAARARAEALGLGLSAYVRECIRRDLVEADERHASDRTDAADDHAHSEPPS